MTAKRKHTTTVRLVVISDTHGHHELLTDKLPDGDILIHCGDFCNRGSHQDAVRFINFLYSDPIQSKYHEIYVVDGNHDHQRTKGLNGDVASKNRQNCDAETAKKHTETSPFDLSALFASKANAQNISNANSLSSTTFVKLLQDEIVTTKRHGMTIYGASWNSCELGTFPLMMQSQKDVDVMIAHINPKLPRRYTIPQLGSPNYKGWLGDVNLFQTVIGHKIPLCLTGHVHWARGVVQVPQCDDPTIKTTSARSTTAPSQPPLEALGSLATNTYFINAASLKPGIQHFCIEDGDSSANMMNKPVVIDYDLITRQPIMIDCDV